MNIFQLNCFLAVASSLSFVHAAKQMNVSVSTISAYETGRCNPSCAVLIRFIRIFHVSADFLLGLSERDTRIFSLDKDEQNILNKLVSTLPTK